MGLGHSLRVPEVLSEKDKGEEDWGRKYAMYSLRDKNRKNRKWYGSYTRIAQGAEDPLIVIKTC